MPTFISRPINVGTSAGTWNTPANLTDESSTTGTSVNLARRALANLAVDFFRTPNVNTSTRMTGLTVSVVCNVGSGNTGSYVTATAAYGGNTLGSQTTYGGQNGTFTLDVLSTLKLFSSNPTLLLLQTFSVSFAASSNVNGEVITITDVYFTVTYPDPFVTIAPYTQTSIARGVAPKVTDGSPTVVTLYDAAYPETFPPDMYLMSMVFGDSTLYSTTSYGGQSVASARIPITINGTGSIRINSMVSSEPDYDIYYIGLTDSVGTYTTYLEISGNEIDGMWVGNNIGNQTVGVDDYFNFYINNLAAGDYTLELQYIKDNYNNMGYDAIVVKEIEITDVIQTPPPTGAVNIASVVATSKGQSGVHTITAKQTVTIGSFVAASRGQSGVHVINVQSSVPINIAGEIAIARGAVPLPSIVAKIYVTTQPPPATSQAKSGVHTVTAKKVVSIASVVATSRGQSGEHGVTALQSIGINIASEIAIARASGVVPSVGIFTAITIDSVVPVARGASGVHTITAKQTVSIGSFVATSRGQSGVHAISGKANITSALPSSQARGIVSTVSAKANIISVVPISRGASGIHTITANRVVSLASPSAQARGEVSIPTVLPVIQVAVYGIVARSQGQALLPTIDSADGRVHATVTSVIASSQSRGIVPTVTPKKVVTLTSVIGVSRASGVVATLKTGVTVSPPSGTSRANSTVPTVTAKQNVSITSPSADLVCTMSIPEISIRILDSPHFVVLDFAVSFQGEITARCTINGTVNHLLNFTGNVNEGITFVENVDISCKFSEVTEDVTFIHEATKKIKF